MATRNQAQPNPNTTNPIQPDTNQPHNPAQGHNISPDNKSQNDKLKELRSPVLNEEDMPASHKNVDNNGGKNPSSL